MKPETAKDYGTISRQFQMATRIAILSFQHHRFLAVESLSAPDRKRLLQRAADRGWTSPRLKQERDIILGKAPPSPTKGFDTGMQALEDEIISRLPPKTPKSAIIKAKKGLESLASELKHEFSDAVEKSAEAKAKVQRENLKAAQGKAEEQYKRAIKMAAGVKAFMSKSEFMLIRKCLHPDTNQHPKAAEAFAIFNRLADVKNW